MTDLDIAKTELYEENLNIAIVKDSSTLYATKTYPINGFIDAIDKCSNKLENAAIAVSTAGKAIALLCAYVKIKEVYAATLSRKAHAVLKTNKIVAHWNKIVENISDQNSDPFEKACVEISDTEKAYKTLKKIQENAKPNKRHAANSLYHSKRKE